MKLIPILHKKPDCIGCGLCVEAAPGYWFMDENGEAQLLNVVREDKFFQYGEGFPSDLDVLRQAEDGCPVDIIRIAHNPGHP